MSESCALHLLPGCVRIAKIGFHVHIANSRTHDLRTHGGLKQTPNNSPRSNGHFANCSMFVLQMTWRPSPLSTLLNTSWSSTRTTCKVSLRSLRYTLSSTSKMIRFEASLTFAMYKTNGAFTLELCSIGPFKGKKNTLLHIHIDLLHLEYHEYYRWIRYCVVATFDAFYTRLLIQISALLTVDIRWIH